MALRPDEPRPTRAVENVSPPCGGLVNRCHIIAQSAMLYVNSASHADCRLLKYEMLAMLLRFPFKRVCGLATLYNNNNNNWAERAQIIFTIIIMFNQITIIIITFAFVCYV